MKHNYCILLLSLVLCMELSAQDSIPGQNIAEVVVTGTRNETDIRHLPMTVSVVDRKQIAQTNMPSLLPLLTEQVPGLFVTSRGLMGYGVSGGAAGTMSLRGLSGGTGQMMVLIDGHPQYMGLMGHPIADAYQSLMAERVEVLRGPASVLYGSNAMGGVVNIVTRRMAEDGVRTHANIGYGSYNTLQTEVTNRIRTHGFSSVISASYNRTDGHRTDMPFEQYGGYAKLGYDFTEAWRIRADVNITHFNASNPGPVDAPLLEADQRITRGMTSIAIENNYERTSGALSFFYNWGNHHINDGYTADPNDDDTQKLFRFRSHDDMMGLSLYQSARLFRGNRLTVGVDYFHFGGHAWNDFVEGEQAGTQQDIVQTALDEVAAYLDFRQDIGSWMTLDAGVRMDWHSKTGIEWVPQAGLSFHLPQQAEIKLSAGKGFRNPTIKEMYMFPPQNPDLLPERLWNYELAVSQKLLDGRLTYGVNLFYINGDNMIQTVMQSNDRPKNVNTGKVENAGVEVQATWHINDPWSVDINYSFLHMENPVLAAPEHKLYVGGMYRYKRCTLSSGVQYVAGLYTSLRPVQKEDFVLWNVRASFHVTRWLDIWLRGDNLLAQSYEINAGYPMPLTTVMAGVNIQL